jgi:hypothetical protein
VTTSSWVTDVEPELGRCEVAEVEITTTGPLFNGGAARAMQAFVEDGTQTIADQGVVLVQQRLGEVLKNPTGYYQSRIDTVRRDNYADVWDSGVIYGNWLERGRSGTRFRGYATFRRAAQELDARAGQIAEQVMPPYIARMNG